jgi:ribosomal protein S18 acetylase RimI-like enzyme
MEAAAMGVPVVATDVRGCRQTVDPGVTGLLIPPRDSGALAAAIEELALDPDRRRAMGRAAREKAERDFDQQRCIEITRSTYTRLLGRAGIAVPTEQRGFVRRAGVADAAGIAALHASRIGEGFLASLGPGFLTQLYRRLVRSPYAVVLVADDEGDADGLAGFIAVSEDTNRFYREFLVKDGVVAAARAAPALARSPKQVWETLRYGTSEDGLPAAEVFAIGVAERAAGGGVGGALLDAALDELRRRDVGAVRVVTAVDNAAALRMYERAGFRRHSRTEVHAGIAQEVLVWR